VHAPAEQTSDVHALLSVAQVPPLFAATCVQVPLAQTSAVQGLLSSVHAVPLSGLVVQPPFAHRPALQASAAAQIGAPVPKQTPIWQLSVNVQPSASLQAVLFALGSLLHPLPAQVAVWHWSEAMHVVGGGVAHPPLPLQKDAGVKAAPAHEAFAHLTSALALSHRPLLPQNPVFPQTLIVSLAHRPPGAICPSGTAAQTPSWPATAQDRHPCAASLQVAAAQHTPSMQFVPAMHLSVPPQASPWRLSVPHLPLMHLVGLTQSASMAQPPGHVVEPTVHLYGLQGTSAGGGLQAPAAQVLGGVRVDPVHDSDAHVVPSA
jgi:hypothetical protein